MNYLYTSGPSLVIQNGIALPYVARITYHIMYTCRCGCLVLFEGQVHPVGACSLGFYSAPAFTLVQLKGRQLVQYLLEGMCGRVGGTEGAREQIN